MGHSTNINQQKSPATIYIVDDDESVRRSLNRLLKSVGFKVKAFASALEFLDYDQQDGSACLIVDLRMSGMNGLELQKRLKTRSEALPIIFVTAYGDSQSREQALRNGAVAFLPKPCDEYLLLEAIQSALCRKTAAHETDLPH